MNDMTKYVNLKLKSTWSRSVVVITSALHAEGLRFDPGRDQIFSNLVTFCVPYFVSILYTGLDFQNLILILMHQLLTKPLQH